MAHVPAAPLFDSITTLHLQLQTAGAAGSIKEYFIISADHHEPEADTQQLNLFREAIHFQIYIILTKSMSYHISMSVIHS